LNGTLVDSNVLIDVMSEDSAWCDWSAAMLADIARREPMFINPIIYTEIAVGFDRIEDLDSAAPASFYRRLPLPWEAAYLAGRCFIDYRRRGGTRRSPMPDLYIGAHAAVADLTLLTRDPQRYATYFPRLRLIAP
jgi:predicted nucleic acid-binding protein